MAKVELITRSERRRRWTVAEKRRILADADAPGAGVAEAARRHEVAEACIYAWRRRFGDGRTEGSGATELVPVMIAPSALVAPVEALAAAVVSR